MAGKTTAINETLPLEPETSKREDAQSGRAASSVRSGLDSKQDDRSVADIEVTRACPASNNETANTTSNARLEGASNKEDGRDNSSDYIEPVSLKEAVGLGYPSLDFRFAILADKLLILAILFWLGVIGAVVTLSVLQITDAQRLHIREQHNYYVSRYGPNIVGLISTIWWRAITQAYNRLIPYVLMADAREDVVGTDGRAREDVFDTDGRAREDVVDTDGRAREGVVDTDGRVAMAAHRLNNADPNLIDIRLISELWRSGHYTTLAVNLLSVSMLVLIPLKTAFIQLTRDSTGWGTVVSPAIGWLIVVWYLALSGATLAIEIRLHGKNTGLKWNPCSLASQIALLQLSNVPSVEACQGMEFDDRRQVVNRLKTWTQQFGVLRLGYWRDIREPTKLFHCIRFFEGEKSRQFGLATQQVLLRREHDPQFAYILKDQEYQEAQAPVAYFNNHQIKYLERHPKPLAFFRYRFIFPTLYMSDWYILTFWVAIFGCLIALSVTLGTKAILRTHSYASFAQDSFVRSVIFSFLSSFLYSSCNIVLLQSDTSHRMLQPIREMDMPAPGRESVLVDYISPNPITIIITACKKAHYRIVWGSFAALTCTIAPIVAGSMFTFDLTEHTFRASPAPTCAALGIACIYVLALPVARIDTKYVASRGLWNIVDTLSLCYDSPILRCPEFTTQGKRDKEDIHMRSQIIRQGRRYQFGYYLGDSGRRRLGFSVAKLVYLQRDQDGHPRVDPASSEEYSVDEKDSTLEPFDGVDRIKARFGALRFGLNWLREPRVVVGDTRVGSNGGDR
ncbi:hypothetical protein QQS21_010121 [Conoideocrella luteorostrata]|uniref:Uncharacterized protein n=1 Tax=Conoideocrella luteorostrata TaxID=1105319 RepID=A0AAJ0CFU1_9HYPO|nr:hypothetical protein QQS21_010121 [Conoideocrella luteorostrata]